MPRPIKILEVQIPENRHQLRLRTQHVPEHRRLLHATGFHARRNLDDDIEIGVLCQLILFGLGLSIAITIAGWWANLHDLRLTVLTENARDPSRRAVDVW